MVNKIERKCLCGFFEVQSVNFVSFSVTGQSDTPWLTKESQRRRSSDTN